MTYIELPPLQSDFYDVECETLYCGHFEEDHLETTGCIKCSCKHFKG